MNQTKEGLTEWIAKKSKKEKKQPTRFKPKGKKKK